MPAHPSAVILPALWAAPCHDPLAGSALLEAYILGVEVGSKIGLAITVGHYHRGFHGTGTLAIFAAVGALGKRYHLDLVTTRTAFGIAASMVSGLQRNFGTMTKPLHTGWAARSALAAVQLARSGVTAAPDGLEAPAGFFAAYGRRPGRKPPWSSSAIPRCWSIGAGAETFPLLLRRPSGHGWRTPAPAPARPHGGHPGASRLSDATRGHARADLLPPQDRAGGQV